MKGFTPLITFIAKKPAKIKKFDSDAIYRVKGVRAGNFSIASNKKELKRLMKSTVDVVYLERKGKLYLNENGEKNGWGAKKVGGLIANFKGKPELEAANFRGLSSYSQDPNNSLDDGIHADAGEESAVVEQPFDRTLGRTAPVFNSMLPGTGFQVESDIRQDFVDGFTGKTSSVKHELGDDIIIRYELNNNPKSPIHHMSIYKGEFSYDGPMLNYAKIDEMISASVSDTFEEHRYWNFSEPRYFDLQRALSFAGFSDFPAPTSTNKDFVVQQSGDYLGSEWWKNLFDQNQII